jgi:hypothetical protein
LTSFLAELTMPRHSLLLRLLILSPTLALAGCGGGEVKVSGKLLKGGVKYAPPEGHRITITLVAIEAKDAAGRSIVDEPFQAMLGEDGESFTVPGREGRGIPPGKYRFAVTQRMTREAFEAAKPEAPPGKPPITRESDFLENKFGEKTSPIVREINGSGSLVIDLDKPTEGASAG